MTAERPVHVVLTGSHVRTVPMADDEWAQMQAADEAANQALQAAETARQADIAAVAERAGQDPAFAALVRLVGLTLPEGNQDAAH